MSDESESPSPAEIEQAIGRTRAELALTVNAIGSRFGARHLMKEGLDMFNDSLAGSDAINRGIAMVRASPVPFALIGIGAAWLFAANTKGAMLWNNGNQTETSRGHIAESAGDVGARAGASLSSAGNALSRSSDRPLGHTGNPVVDQPAHDRSSGWVHQMNDAAQGALRSVRDTGAAAMDRAGIYAGDGAKRLAAQLIDTAQCHPLLLGAVGIMAGALAASLMPLSRTEEEWIGGTRDAFWHRAGDAGQQAIARIREAATHAVDAAAAATSESLEEAVGGTKPHVET